MAEPTPCNGQPTDAMTQQQIGTVTSLSNLALQNAIQFQQAMNLVMIEKAKECCCCKCKKER